MGGEISYLMQTNPPPPPSQAGQTTAQSSLPSFLLPPILQTALDWGGGVVGRARGERLQLGSSSWIGSKVELDFPHPSIQQ